MSYNKDTDYQAKIDEAVKSGDYQSAAQYEKSRNEKIDAENLDYEKTNKYSGWLDNTDYSTIIKDQIASGASKSAVSDSLKKRISKSSGTEGLTQYAYDDVYDDAIKYIMGGNFSYAEKVPEYKSSYDEEIKQLLNELRNEKGFRYNPEDDELYAYYKKQYNLEGKRAMEDILGELAANTGGVASSYAVSTAAQSLDYYNQKLADKIPQLYSDAYKRYMDGLDAKGKYIELLSNYDNDKYSEYLDSLEQYNKNREFSYKAFTDEVSREDKKKENERDRENEERKLELMLREIENKEAETENNQNQQSYDNEYTSEQDEIMNALKKWQILGYLDSESAKILGLPEGLHASDYDYRLAQQYNLYNR